MDIVKVERWKSQHAYLKLSTYIVFSWSLNYKITTPGWLMETFYAEKNPHCNGNQTQQTTMVISCSRLHPQDRAPPTSCIKSPFSKEWRQCSPLSTLGTPLVYQGVDNRLEHGSAMKKDREIQAWPRCNCKLCWVQLRFLSTIRRSPSATAKVQ